jgi:hypothetical protein
MDASLLTPSKYIKSSSFAGKEPTLTIASVRLEELEKDDGTKETKGVVEFKERSRQPPHGPLLWLLNVTNAKSLITMFGKETDTWANKRVTLYAQPMKVQGEDTTGIRVRGSPDIERDVRFMMKLRKRKPQEIVLRKTGGAPVPMPEEAPAP